MMKKLLLSLFLMLSVGIEMSAVPMYPKPVKIHQADGSYITIVGHGDEYLSYTTTVDGYTIVRGAGNIYHYAQLSDGKLVATDVVAHDADQRGIEEQNFLSAQEKDLRPSTQSSIKRLAPMPAERQEGVDYTEDTPWLAKKAINKQNYRGLVILVNYNDTTFSRGDENTKEIFTTLMNGQGVTSFYDPYFGSGQTVTGSVRDYFCDNSYGQFNPQFDVYGPVTIDYSQYYVNGSENTLTIANAAINAIDSQVDFSKYDADGDGVVDMFYIIYAGYARSYSGNDDRLLHPHATHLYEKIGKYYYYVYKDGVQLGRYACSTELYGWKVRGDMQINGIGTICHEFSHVLGYADHYDTANQGHQNPQNWDVMASGSYNGNYGFTPAGYNAYERYTGGFMTPVTLTAADAGITATMPALESEGKAYRINTKATSNEYFLFENRQKVKWDSCIPGNGMLVWRVDSTNPSLWTMTSNSNFPNATNHLCMQLIRANGWVSDMADSQNDAFPGSKNVTMLTNATSPANLMSYYGVGSPLVAKKIQVSDGVVTFVVTDSDAGRKMPEGAIFYESFDDCLGTGGNDGIFGVSMKPSIFAADNDGWSCTTKVGCDSCARFGSSSLTRETVTMPSVTLDASRTYQLTFKAAPYSSDATNWTLTVASGDATVLNDDLDGAEASTSATFTMTKNQWTQCSFTVKGSGTQTFTFKGATSNGKRILLDEVVVKDITETAIAEVQTSESKIQDCKYIQNGRIVIVRNGKRYNVSGMQY